MHVCIHTCMCAFTHTVNRIEIFLNRSLCTMTKAVTLQKVGSESKGVSCRKSKKTQSKAKPPKVETELGLRHLCTEESQTLLATDRSLGEREGNSSSEPEETSIVDADFRVPVSEMEENSFLSSNITQFEIVCYSNHGELIGRYSLRQLQ